MRYWGVSRRLNAVEMKRDVLVFLAEVGTYLVLRHNKVGLHDLQGQFQTWLKSFKKKQSSDEHAPPSVSWRPQVSATIVSIGSPTLERSTLPVVSPRANRVISTGNSASRWEI